MNMKGILLAGGHGTRLHPTTISISKHLIPIYDKPMIYYPLSVLMLAKIRDVVVIVSPEHEPLYKKLLGDGTRLGMRLQYLVQTEPRGIADAFLLAKDYIKNSSVCLALGDNIFHGQGMTDILTQSIKGNTGATIFGHAVHDPSRFGVVQCDPHSNIISIEEKPSQPKSNIAVTGLYFFDETVVEKAEAIKPSNRGELEISSILQLYLEEKKLALSMLGRGFAWLDTGTSASLLEASNFVRAIEHSQGMKIACLEEIAFDNDWIDRDHYLELADLLKNTPYGQYMASKIKWR